MAVIVPAVNISTTTPLNLLFPQHNVTPPLTRLDISNESGVTLQIAVQDRVYFHPAQSTISYPLNGSELGFTVTPLAAPTVSGALYAVAYTDADQPPAQVARGSNFLGGSVGLPVDPLIVAGAGTVVLGLQVTGDIQDRFQLLGNGEHDWGSGNGAMDTRLFRSAPGVLTIANELDLVTLVATATITAPQFLAIGGNFSARYYQKDTASAADSKVWDIVLNGSQQLHRLLNDAENTALNWMTVTRNGIASVAVTIAGPITVGGSDSAIGPGATGAGKFLHIAQDASWNYLGGSDSTGLANGNLYLQSGNIYQQLYIASGTYDWYLFGGALGMRLDSNGNIRISGANLFAGTAANGATNGAYVQLGDLADPGGVYFAAQGNGTSTNVSIHIRTKGTGTFSIENGSGNALLQIVSTHIITQGVPGVGAPTVTPGMGAGWTAAVTGTDVAGKVTITNNTGGNQTLSVNQLLFTLTFAAAYGAVPIVVVCPAETNAAALTPYVDYRNAGGVTTGAFNVRNWISQLWSNGVFGIFTYHVLG